MTLSAVEQATVRSVIAKHDQITRSSKRKARPVEEITVEEITPEIAQGWITEDVNSNNRNLVTKKVTQYARDMEEGRWQFNNDAICFDVHGVLLNGQHRLHACVLSGKTLRSVIIRGMQRKAQKTMDQHSVRSVCGMLQIDGHQRSSRLGGALRSLMNLKYAGQAFNSYRPSAAEQIELLGKHPQIEESVAMVDKTCKGISSSLLAAIHYVATHLLDEGEKADAFVRVFGTGIPAYKNDPAHALRENSIRHADRKTRKAGSLAFYSLIRAWNLFRDDQQITRWNSPKADVVPMKGLKTDLI